MMSALKSENERVPGGQTCLCFLHKKSCVVGNNFRDQFKTIHDADGSFGCLCTNNKSKVDIHAIGRQKLPNCTTRVMSDAEMEMTEWINYLLVMKYMPILLEGGVRNICIKESHPQTCV